jgi:hypothetical protein
MKLAIGNLLFVVVLVGCHSNSASVAKAKSGRTPKPATEPTQAGQAFRLKEEPAGGKSVLAVREESKDGEDVVIVGRIGGSRKPFTGRAAFTIVDDSIKPCNEIGDDACPTPWDYCCGVGKEDLAKGTALVKLLDDDGQTRTDDARSMFGLTELQTVVVRGKAKRDDAGNLTIHMNGIYVRNPKGSP